MKHSKLMLFVCLFCLAVTASAQKTWEKPYQNWSKEDAQRILTDSPWSQSYQSAGGAIAAGAAQSARDQSDQRIMGRPETGRVSRNLGPSPIVIRLQSGLPIRQALIRLQQIQGGYDKMSEADRKKFDDNSKGFLDCAICQNYYVVTITKFRKPVNDGVDDGMFETLKPEDLKGHIRLANDKGEERELVQFIAPKQAGESAALFFPKRDDKGNMLVMPDTKTLKLVFSNQFLENINNPYGHLLQRHFEFKVSKMLMNGAVAF